MKRKTKPSGGITTGARMAWCVQEGEVGTEIESRVQRKVKPEKMILQI